MVKGSEMEGVEVHEAVLDTLNRTLVSLRQLETELPQFLSLSDPQFLAQLPLLQRAHSLFSLAKLASTLFSLKLRCRGINPVDHPVKSELDKINLLQKKLERLPRLSEAQRQDTRNTNGGDDLQMKDEECAGQKRKHPSSEQQIDAMESLENKAELLGDNKGSIRGAIVIDISDDDDDDDDDELLAR
ncbi:nuclear nucleic acid-binding protein C1D-like [Abrus precatorius]|uniref:Nuclear nucleic acid-binding protein C1D n=1 Tax=Abrus precatorius TaxID=3816 RepID=A0A8B8JNW1_ABRPR|nr:nuclear nucleic acid-binding protein C1D-like [Abrus precatorius]